MSVPLKMVQLRLYQEVVTGITHVNRRLKSLLAQQMSPGDVFLFRGDTIHGGGENKSDVRPSRAVAFLLCGLVASS